MKKIFLFILIIVLIFCGCEKKVGPGDVLDNDTGKVYSLGNSKEVFDQAFGSSEYNDITEEWEYLSKMLCVAFDEENKAVRIKVDSKTNRFSFNNFDFSKPMSDINGRYSEYKMSGVTAYNLYFSQDGKVIELSDAVYMENYIAHTLFVYNEDDEILGRKKGAYEFYYIELREGGGIKQP